MAKKDEENEDEDEQDDFDVGNYSTSLITLTQIIPHHDPPPSSLSIFTHSYPGKMEEYWQEIYITIKAKQDVQAIEKLQMYVLIPSTSIFSFSLQRY